MPRNNDPADVTVGTGLAADESIEANALVHPTGGNEGLRVHIQDPSRAHMASAIGIEDAGNYYVSDNVEGALQEIGAGMGAGRSNGLVSGGEFLAPVGLTVTLNTTQILLNGISIAYTGQSVVLADNQTQYVYVDAATGNLVTTGGPVPPALELEPVLLREFTTAAGAVTGERDARFFVINLDRKPPLTLRNNGAASETNINSEGAFETLESVFLHLELYAAGGPGNPMETHRILVRGQLDLDQTYQIPIDGVILEGEGDAKFSTAGTGAVAPMFDLNGKNNVEFKNLTFICNDSGSTAVEDTTGHSNYVKVERCWFLDGLSRWDYAINIQDNSAPNIQHIIKDSWIFATTRGIAIDRALGALIDNVNVLNDPDDGGSIGIQLNVSGPNPGEGQSVVRRCSVGGFDRGISVDGDDTTVRDCLCYNQRYGVVGGTGSRITINNVAVFLDSADGPGNLGGIDGITLQGNNGTVKDCRLINPRVAWTASTADTHGIRFTAGAGAADSRVEGCVVSNFYNPNALTGSYGVRFPSNSNRSFVSDTYIQTSQFGIHFAVPASSDMKIHNTQIDEVETAVSGNGERCIISDSTFILDATRGEEALLLTGTGWTLDHVWVENPRVVWGIGVITQGLFMNGADATISGCRFKGFWNTVDNTGYGLNIFNASRSKVLGTSVESCWGAISIFASDDVKVADSNILDFAEGIRVTGDRAILTGNRLAASSTAGIYGIIGQNSGLLVSDSLIENPRTGGAWGAGDDPYGIHLNPAGGNISDINISGCQIVGWLNDNTGTVHAPLGGGVEIAPNVSNITVSDCSIVQAARGIQNANNASLRVDGCTIVETRWGVLTAAGGTGLYVNNTSILLDLFGSQYGLTGIDSQTEQTLVSDCSIQNLRSAWGVDPDTSYGVRLRALDGMVSDSRINGFLNLAPAVSPVDSAISIEASGCKAHGNNIAPTSAVATGGYGIWVGAASGIEGANVSDNFIDGSAKFQNCIRLDGSSAPVLNSMVTSNTVLGATTHLGVAGRGIYLYGLVLDTVVDGNIVDMADPTTAGVGPVTTTADGIVLETAGGASRPQRVMVSNNNVWRATNGILAKGGLVNRVEDVTIEGNTVHHCAFPQAGVLTDTFDGAGCKGIGAEFARGLSVLGNNVFRIGQFQANNGTENSPATGPLPDVLPTGIFTRNCDRVTVSDNDSENHEGDGLGFAIGIYIQQRSTGGAGGTFATSDFMISNNRVRWDPSVPIRGYFGIAVRAGAGTDVGTVAHEMTGVSLTGNSVKDTELDGILVGCSDECVMRRVLVSDNNITDIGSLGGIANGAITVFGADEGLGGDIQVTDVMILDNIITVTNASNGILVLTQKANIFSLFDIRGNEVNSTGEHGIYVASTVALTAFGDVKVQSNTVKGFAAGKNGIRVEGTTAITACRAFDIRDNTALSTTGAAGILFQTVETDVSEVFLVGNKVTGEGAAFPGAGIGIRVTSPVAAHADLENVMLSENHVHTLSFNGLYLDVDGLLTRATVTENQVLIDGVVGYPLFIDVDYQQDELAGLYHDTVLIADNTFEGGVGTEIDFWGNATSALADQGPGVRNVKVVNNIFKRADEILLNFEILHVNQSALTDAAYNLTFDNNTFEESGTGGIVLQLGDVDLTSPTYPEELKPTKNISVSGNKFYEVHTSGLFNDCVKLWTWSDLANVQVVGNEFENCGAFSNGASGTIWVLLANTGSSSQEITVRGNTMRSCLGAGILIEDDPLVGANYRVSTLNVFDNIVANASHVGIKADFTAFTSAAILDISRNQIRENTVLGSNKYGVHVLTPDTVEMRDLRICDNTIVAVNDTAIRIDAQDDIYGFTIDDNSIGLVTGGEAIYITGGETMEDVSICGNLLQDIQYNGIRVYNVATSPSSRIYGFVINDNKIRSVGTALAGQNGNAILIYPQTGAGTDPNLRDLMITNNGINGVGGDDNFAIRLGQSPLAGSGGDFIQIGINENNIRSSDGGGIAVWCNGVLQGLTISSNNLRDIGDDLNVTWGEKGIYVLNTSSGGATSDVSVVGNTIFDTREDGILVQANNGGSLYGITVSNNTIHNWSSSALTNTWSAIEISNGITSTESAGITVVGNACVGDGSLDRAVGLSLLFSRTSLRALTVAANVVRFGSPVTNTTSMITSWATVGGDPTPYDLAFTGNSFQGANTAIAPIPSAVTASKSTVSGNNESTAGVGLGGWAAFYAAVFNGAQCDNTGLNQD